jgi:hypothetical protein
MATTSIAAAAADIHILREDSGTAARSGLRPCGTVGGTDSAGRFREAFLLPDGFRLRANATPLHAKIA